MHTEQTIDKFVELRAQGWSLGHIATELHVSKRTLVDWNREFAADIRSFRKVEQQLLQEKFLSTREEEVNRLFRLQKDIHDELANRTLKYIDIDKLFRLSIELRQEIQRVVGEQASHQESAEPDANGDGRGVLLAAEGTAPPLNVQASKPQPVVAPAGPHTN